MTDQKKRTRRTGPVQKKRRRSYRRVRKILGVILLLAGFWYLNYGSPFIIREVRITTDSNLDAQKISSQFNTASIAGVNVLYLPVDEIRRSFLNYPEISDVRINRLHPGKLEIDLKSAVPVYALTKPWGFYLLGSDGNYIKTAPPYAHIGTPMRFHDESRMFDSQSRPIPQPWKDALSYKDIDDETLMLALGFRDMLLLAELVRGDQYVRDVEFIGYDVDYGLVLKCKGKSLILLGYGDNLPAHFDQARRILNDPKIEHSYDRYIDIRFTKFHSSKLLDNLPQLFQ